MFCKKCYHSIHVYACRSEWICSKCTYVRVNDWIWIPFLYALRRIATSHSMLARRMYVCMYVCIQLNMVLVLVPSNWMWMLAKLVVCMYKQASNIHCGQVSWAAGKSPIHTYMHACYTMLNAPHSNRRHESYRPCDCGSSSSSSSSMEKSWTATPEMIQSMKSARWEWKLNSINTVRWKLVNLWVCVTSYGDWNLQWTVQGKKRKKARLYLNISSYS